ncbi:MAG: hypothetical protein PW792_03005 [Acidobacteriaceae bacterium]|nr:hypothetical protein [Acidobacteriaceae bacterium]
MALHSSFLQRNRSFVRGSVASALAVFLSFGVSGCGVGTLAGSSAPSTGAFTLSGNLHGGQQPIIGATVNLYRTGTTGYGKGSTLLATYTTGTGGNFAFTKSATNSDAVDGSTATWACPTAGDPQIYLLAIGGNTQGQAASTTTSGNSTITTSQSNTASVMMSALGKCSTISSSTVVQINEMTTVASVVALQQYINPGTSAGTATVGTSSSTQGTVGLNNAQSGITNLVNIASGQPMGVNTVTNNGLSVTVTPEAAKLVTMANILAACINSTNGVTTTTTTTNGSSNSSSVPSTSTSCADLMAAAAPPALASTTSQPSATFNAAVDTLQAAYYMAVNPTDAGTVASCQSTSGATTNIACLYGLSSSIGPFAPGLTAVPTDWTIGVNYASTSACTYGSFLLYPYLLESDAQGNIWAVSGGSNATLSELSPAGVPQVCALGNTASGRGIAIDIAGYVWISAYTGTSGILRYDPTSSSSIAFNESGITPYAITADGSGNIFYTSSVSKIVRELPGASSATAAVTGQTIGGAITATPYFMAVDQAGRIWVTDTSTTGGLYDFYPDTSANATNGYSTANVGSTTYTYNNYGIAVDGSNVIWMPNSSSRNTLGWVTPASASTATLNATAAYAGGITSPRGAAVDGAGNIWAPNGVAELSGLYSVSKFDKSGNALSPTVGTTSAANNGGYQKPTTVFSNTLRGVTIDPSGNVWMGSNTTTGTSIAEIVGAAVPVVMPLSVQLQNGTVATKP